MASIPKVVAGIVLVLTALIAEPAFASIPFPPTIQTELALAAPPACVLCHRTEVGGLGTVVTPFGRTMMNRFGVSAANVASLKAALAASEAQHIDSDGDGASDIEELRAGMDPNVGLSGEVAGPGVPLPETGCAFASRLPSGSTPVLAVLFAGFALVFVRRRARRVRSLLRAAAMGGPSFVVLAGCSLDTRQLRFDVPGGDAGAQSSSPGHAGASGSHAGAAALADAGASGADEEGGAPPSVTAGSAGALQEPLVDGCPDLDENGIADCQETLLKNSDFKLDVDSWTPDTGTTVTWDEANATADLPSGSARLTTNSPGGSGAPGSTLRVARQCLPVSGKQLVTAYANAWVDSGQAQDGHAEVDVYFFDVEGCAGAYVTSFSTPQPLDAAAGSWLTLKAGSVGSPSTKSVLVTLALSAPLSATAFSARFDNVLVKAQTL